MIESIAAVGELPNIELAAQVQGTASNTVAGGTGDFGALIGNGLEQVNQQLLSTQTDLHKLAIGDVQNLHQVMINLEEARMSFQLMMQVRNRALDTYQDLMKMSV